VFSIFIIILWSSSRMDISSIPLIGTDSSLNKKSFPKIRPVIKPADISSIPLIGTDSS